MATGVSVSASGTSAIDTTLYGMKWSSTALTYSFPSLASALSGYAVAPNSAHVSGLTGTEQQTVEAALQAWSNVSGLTFSETGTASASDISIYWYLPPIVLDGYGNMASGNPTAQVVDFPGSTQEAGDIQLGTYVVPGAIASWDAGNYPYLTILHEIGHALGLKHPHDDINGFPAAAAEVDSIQMSVMSYRSFPGGDVTGYTIPSGSFPAGLMPNDIAAIQYLYGANWSTNSGDSTYTFDPGAEVVLATIWDGGGTDTYDFDSYTTNLSIDLTPGAWSNLGSQYAATEYTLEDDVVVPTSTFNGNLATPYLYGNDPRSLIENAKGGSGNDTLTGNQADNALTGNAGNDVLTGGTGADTLIGGAGTDSLQGGDGNDAFRGSVGDMSGLSETIDGGDGIDTLWLTGSGTADLTSAIVTDLEVITMTQASAIQTVTLGSGQTGALTAIQGTRTAGAADDVVNVASGNLSLSDQADILLLNLTAAGAVQTVTAGTSALLGVTVTGTGDDIVTATGNLDLTGATLTGIAELTFGSSAAASTLTLDTTTLAAGLPINGFGAGDTITINGVTLSGTVSQGDGTVVAAHSVQFGTPSGGRTTLHIDTDGVADAAELSLVLKGSYTPNALISLSGSSIRHALPPADSGGGGGSESPSPVSNTTTNGVTTTTVTPIPVGTTTPVTIDLGTGTNNSLSASLPGGTSLNASGPQNPVAPTQLSQTVVAMVSTISADPTQQAVIGDAISTFVSTLPPTTSVAVRTITPTVVAGTAPNTPISITGSAGGGEAVVLDTRGLPSGTVITVNNVDFLAVVGNVQLSGGDGSQSVVCDGSAQYVVLGADDDTLRGGGGDDFVGSKTGNDLLYGEEGNDSVQGGDDGDLLFGNVGTDLLLGNMGADTLYGGRDNDTVYGGRDDDLLFGDIGDDNLMGDLGNDRLVSGDGADAEAGGDGADLLLGNAGIDLLLGNMGADTLYGGVGGDTLYGGREDDLLFGDPGDDLLSGDVGSDTLTGGAGADVFVFRAGDGSDVVSDFRFAEGDRIGLAGGARGYTLRTTGAGDAVIVFSDSDTVTLTGVRVSDINAGWFVPLAGG